MDNPKSPITFSEIPPQNESSGLSLFNRLGEKSVSQISESSPKSHKSSSSKSLKQTFIENWINTTSKTTTLTKDAEHKIPPWATLNNKVNCDAEFSFGSTAVSKQQREEEIEDLCELGSECSLPIMDDKLDSKSAADKLIFNDEEYSIMARDFGSILSNEDPYVTPRPDLSLKTNSVSRLSPFQDNEIEEAAPFISKTYNELDTRDTVPYTHNSTSQATIPYNRDSSSQATLPYNHDTSSQATIPYNYDDSSQATLPYDCHEGSQETMPYDADAGSSSEDLYTANESILVFNDEEQADIPNTETNLLKSEDEADLPSITSPTHILDDESILGSPDIGHEELEELAKIADELSNRDKRQHDQTDVAETPLQSSCKMQRLNSSSSEKKQIELSSLEQQEMVKLVRPDKKQIRVSTLKQPMTIENYFLLSSETKRQGEEDIGRDSVTPSTYSGRDKVTKKEEKSTMKSIDKRKRPSFGLSKNV